MRIALCLEYPLSLRGGVSVLVETLMQEFTARGHEIVLVSPDTTDDLKSVESGKWIYKHIHFAPKKITIADAKNLARQIAAIEPDVAHFHSGGAYIWGGRFPFHCPIIYLDRLKVPCFSTAHSVVGLFEGYCGPQKPFWFKALMLPLAWTGKAQQLFHTRCEIAASGDNYDKLRCWYFPFAKKIAKIYHSQLRHEPIAQIVPREKIILNVGHLAWRKGQLILAQAFAQIAPRYPDWILQFAGHDADGQTVRQIQNLANEQKLESRIFFLGDRRDVLDLMKRAAIYVQPSFQEALGLALQEAMFMGCASIGSRTGGIPELISENQTGLLFEPGNVAELSAALEQLIKSESRREQFGRAAAESIRARGMTAGKMAKNYLELYESIR